MGKKEAMLSVQTLFTYVPIIAAMILVIVLIMKIINSD